MTWRSWWDGGNTRGPIATYYRVRGWPTIYVIDHKGVIRYKNVRGDAMNKAVEALLVEAENADEQEARELPIVGAMSS